LKISSPYCLGLSQVSSFSLTLALSFLGFPHLAVLGSARYPPSASPEFFRISSPCCLGLSQVSSFSLTLALSLHPREVHSCMQKLEAAQMFSINPSI